MRRIARIDRSIGLLKIRTPTTLPSSYLCLSCRSRNTPFSTSSLHAEQKGKLDKGLDKLRKKIWGTDTPPGLENPYGGEGVFEKNDRRRKEKKEETNELEISEQPQQTAKAPEHFSSYEPADTWDDLEHVGGFEDWDPSHPFKSFVPAEVESHTEKITACLHRAMVEVFTVQQAGKPLAVVSQTLPGEDFTADIQLVPSATGVSLQFTETVPMDKIVQSLAPLVDETKEKVAPTESEEDVAADRSTIDPLHPQSPELVDETATKEAPTESEEDVAADRSTVDPLNEDASPRYYTDVIAAWDPSWLQISLENPEIKFAVLKRVLQLTGIRISDSVISSSNTAKALLAHLITPPKPRKLVDALEQKEELLTLPNVHVYPSRITPIDKEQRVGRWKVIEKELQERGLPVLGH